MKRHLTFNANGFGQNTTFPRQQMVYYAQQLSWGDTTVVTASTPAHLARGSLFILIQNAPTLYPGHPLNNCPFGASLFSHLPYWKLSIQPFYVNFISHSITF